MASHRSTRSSIYLPDHVGGLYWNKEEARHQEHLERVLYAQYLLHHRNDSEDAERVYRSFVAEQDRWLAEQAEIRKQEEIEAMIAYDQRAERWRQDWMKVEQQLPGELEIPLVAGIYFKEHRFPSALATAAPSCSSLYLPPPLVVSPAIPEVVISDPGGRSCTQIDGSVVSKAADRLYAVVQGTLPSKRNTLHEGDRIAPSELSLDTDGSDNYVRSPLITGDILKVVGHRPWKKHALLYQLQWKSHEPGSEAIMRWVKATDVPQRSIIDKYHIQRKLGPVKWSKLRYQQQARSSGSFGIDYIKTVLEGRKNELLLMDLPSYEADQQISEERWRIRSDWQHRGRGWGAAVEVVQERIQAWRAIEKLRNRQSIGDDENIEDGEVNSAESVTTPKVTVPATGPPIKDRPIVIIPASEMVQSSLENPLSDSLAALRYSKRSASIARRTPTRTSSVKRVETNDSALSMERTPIPAGDMQSDTPPKNFFSSAFYRLTAALRPWAKGQADAPPVGSKLDQQTVSGLVSPAMSTHSDRPSRGQTNIDLAASGVSEFHSLHDGEPSSSNIQNPEQGRPNVQSKHNNRKDEAHRSLSAKKPSVKSFEEYERKEAQCSHYCHCQCCCCSRVKYSTDTFETSSSATGMPQRIKAKYDLRQLSNGSLYL